jgi:hypothetical protein
MRKGIAIAFLALLFLVTSSLIAFADEDEGNDDENEGENEGNENENGNNLPGFEVALAIACSFGMARIMWRSI